MSSGKIGAGGRDGWTDRGSIRGPRGPKNIHMISYMSANTRGVDLIPHTATTRTALSWEKQKEVVGSYLLNRPIFMVPRANQFSHRLKTCVQHFGANIQVLDHTHIYKYAL